MLCYKDSEMLHIHLLVSLLPPFPSLANVYFSSSLFPLPPAPLSFSHLSPSLPYFLLTTSTLPSPILSYAPLLSLCLPYSPLLYPSFWLFPTASLLLGY